MKKILVADDNAVSRELVREALESDYEIIEASNGAEAVERIRSAHPDLVLVDIQMPALDGYGVLEQVRLDPDFTATRLVALTAFAMQGDRERAMDAGFDGYITKPINVLALRAQVKLLLAASSSAGIGPG
jgi:CheY-like chemotaxis protein